MPLVALSPMITDSTMNLESLAQAIKSWGQELGFAQVAITDVDMTEHGERLIEWLEKGYHGEMAYMADHDDMR